VLHDHLRTSQLIPADGEAGLPSGSAARAGGRAAPMLPLLRQSGAARRWRRRL